MSIQPEAHFLHLRDQQLQTSGPVSMVVSQAKHLGDHIPNEPSAKIDAYLGKLVSHSLMETVPDDDPVEAAKILEKRRRQIDARVIKSEDIPESFFETQRRAAHEQGYGDITIDEHFKAEAVKVLQTDQRESLRDWVDYLTDKDSEYPIWFKYYTYRAITKLSDYDKDKGEFPKRSRRTTDPFPALNREALSYVYDELLIEISDFSRLKHPSSKTEEDRQELKKLEGWLKQADFGKLYAQALSEIGFSDPELLKETRGSWVKYHQSDDPKDVQRLSHSLKGYGTGWCTAGEGYARTQLANGDFFVYYTLDKDGVARVPRIAVRMEHGYVGEVRGIVGGSPNAGPAENTSQEMEPAMIDIAMEKVKDLPGGEDYFQAAADMKRVTALEAKVKANQDLSQEDLIFLYEIEHTIKGFGFGSDPRIAELIESRNSVKEILQIFADNPDMPDPYRKKDRALISSRIEEINQKIKKGESFNGEDLEFIYGFNGSTRGLGYDNLPEVYDLFKDRYIFDDFPKLAESLAKSEEKTKQVQAEAMKIYAAIAISNKDKTPLSADAISLMYDPSKRLTKIFPNPISEMINQLYKHRVYGPEYVAMQKDQKEKIMAMSNKIALGEDLSTSELKFLYEINSNVASKNKSLLAKVLAERNIVADIDRLLAEEPKYEIWAEELREKAVKSNEVIRINKLLKSGKHVSDEEIDFLNHHTLSSGKVFDLDRVL